ncbi:MAG: hypothetical protein HPKKFMNG_01870 [Planctomycetes bacterium]|nr:hypothetical protein [Planctomycetota bacterium]
MAGSKAKRATMVKDVQGRWDRTGTVRVDLTVGEVYDVVVVLAGHPVVSVPVGEVAVQVQLVKGEATLS